MCVENFTTRRARQMGEDRERERGREGRDKTTALTLAFTAICIYLIKKLKVFLAPNIN